MSVPDAQSFFRLLCAAQGAEADGESLERELVRGLLSQDDAMRVSAAQSMLYQAARSLRALAREHGHVEAPRPARARPDKAQRGEA